MKRRPLPLVCQKLDGLYGIHPALHISLVPLSEPEQALPRTDDGKVSVATTFSMLSHLHLYESLSFFSVLFLARALSRCVRRVERPF